MPTWVDDSGLVGPSAHQLTREKAHLQSWASYVLGVFFKAIKDKAPAQVQHMTFCLQLTQEQRTHSICRFR